MNLSKKKKNDCCLDNGYRFILLFFNFLFRRLHDEHIER